MATDERSEAELRERVAELEDRIDNLTTGGEVAVDAEGREWSTADIMNLGLTRRQALGVLAVLAGSGVTIWTAIQEATGVASATGTAEVGQLGEPGRPVDGYIEDLYDTNGNPVLEFQGDGSVKSVSTDQTHTVIQATASQTIPSGAVETVEFDTVSEDQLNAADTANNQIVVQDDGKYLAVAHILWESDGGWSTGDRAEIQSINAGGSRVTPSFLGVKIGTDRQGLNAMSTPTTLTSGEAVDATAYQDSGSDQSLGGGPSAPTRVQLGLFKIG